MDAQETAAEFVARQLAANGIQIDYSRRGYRALRGAPPDASLPVDDFQLGDWHSVRESAEHEALCALRQEGRLCDQGSQLWRVAGGAAEPASPEDDQVLAWPGLAPATEDAAVVPRPPFAIALVDSRAAAEVAARMYEDRMLDPVPTVVDGRRVTVLTL